MTSSGNCVSPARIFGTLLLLLLLPCVSTSQTRVRPNEKFGEPDSTWWKHSTYPADSSVAAVILFDYAECEADVYWGTKFKQTRRIKIYRKRAIDKWANAAITGQNKLTAFECNVYNLENGKITVTSLDKSKLMNDNVAGAVKRAAVAIPNVKEGSVIEYTYSIKLTYFVIPRWDFQHSIPVEWSEYQLFFQATDIGIVPIISGLYRLSDYKVRKDAKQRKYVMKDLPAFEPEPLMFLEAMFRSSIRFRPTWVSGFKPEIYDMESLKEYGLRRDSITLDTRTSTEFTLNVTPDGELHGTLRVVKAGYEGLLARRAIRDQGKEVFLKDELNKNAWSATKSELVNEEDSLKDLVLHYDLSIPDQVQMNDSMMYINPYLVIRDEKNLFTQEKRVYPIDFGSRTVRSTTTILTIPAGYEIVELPKSSAIQLPNSEASFRINASSIANKIYLTSFLKTNKIIFGPDQYKVLKEFFGLIVSKKSEMVVLRKKRK